MTHSRMFVVRGSLEFYTSMVNRACSVPGLPGIAGFQSGKRERRPGITSGVFSLRRITHYVQTFQETMR